MSVRDDAGAIVPHDEAYSGRQIAWLSMQCADQAVLDVGAGEGRVAAVVAPLSSRYVALDHDPIAIERCGACCDAIEVLEADMHNPPLAGQHFDVVLCLGNTFCLLWDVDQAVETLRAWRALLAERGVVVIDDIPQNLWPEVAEGYWASGISEDGSTQLVWEADDAVMALRTGDEIDPGQPSISEADRPMRLWTSGCLMLAARLAGFEAPEHIAEASVLVLRPATSAHPG
jgi:SAM-dependent methyltransferase